MAYKNNRAALLQACAAEAMRAVGCAEGVGPFTRCLTDHDVRGAVSRVDEIGVEVEVSYEARPEQVLAQAVAGGRALAAWLRQRKPVAFLRAHPDVYSEAAATFSVEDEGLGIALRLAGAVNAATGTYRIWIGARVLGAQGAVESPAPPAARTIATVGPGGRMMTLEG